MSDSGDDSEGAGGVEWEEYTANRGILAQQNYIDVLLARREREQTKEDTAGEEDQAGEEDRAGEEEGVKMRAAAIIIQRRFRGFLERRKYLDKIAKIIKIQRWWRKCRIQLRLYDEEVVSGEEEEAGEEKEAGEEEEAGEEHGTGEEDRAGEEDGAGEEDEAGKENRTREEDIQPSPHPSHLQKKKKPPLISPNITAAFQRLFFGKQRKYKEERKREDEERRAAEARARKAEEEKRRKGEEEEAERESRQREAQCEKLRTGDGDGDKELSPNADK